MNNNDSVKTASMKTQCNNDSVKTQCNDSLTIVKRAIVMDEEKPLEPDTEFVIE
ncbi:hypothetical protein A2U01_0083061 [Trifolium medium]|uniref:Uncharacterized protein n=1 Tax=Trifolium medium TaxID=97028 RepID=A0A392TMG9_9FABA|nr:hypothetical protein [Trifolium medium]